MYFPEPKYQTTTIANGANLSAALGNDIMGFVPVAFSTDGIDTTTTVTFQIKGPDGVYYDVWDDAVEYAVTGVAAGKLRALNPQLFLAATNIKVRTGTGAAPTNQAGLRTITLFYRALS